MNTCSQNILNENVSLEPIQLIELILDDKKNVIQEIVSDILFQLSDTTNIIYPLSVNYLY